MVGQQIPSQATPESETGMEDSRPRETGEGDGEIMDAQQKAEAFRDDDDHPAQENQTRSPQSQDS